MPHTLLAFSVIADSSTPVDDQEVGELSSAIADTLEGLGYAPAVEIVGVIAVAGEVTE